MAKVLLCLLVQTVFALWVHSHIRLCARTGIHRLHSTRVLVGEVACSLALGRYGGNGMPRCLLAHCCVSLVVHPPTACGYRLCWRRTQSLTTKDNPANEASTLCGRFEAASRVYNPEREVQMFLARGRTEAAHGASVIVLTCLPFSVYVEAIDLTWKITQR